MKNPLKCATNLLPGRFMLCWELFIFIFLSYFFTHFIQSFSHKEENAMKRLLWVCLLVLGLMLSWTLVYAADFYVVPTKKKSYAPVEKTGQIAYYATGDDGDLEKGVTWPSPRFTEKDGTVKDNLTGLVWLKNANCFGMRVWATALTDCNSLNSDECGLSDGSAEGDWRLPNVKELQSLIDYGRSNPALPTDHPFTGVESSYYWSSTTYAGYTSDAWYMYVGSGDVDYYDKASYADYVWPVRSDN